MTKNLKDVLDSLSKKEKLDSFDIKKSYVPYVVNKCYSRVLFSLFYANEMNKYHFLPKEMQYDFYFYGLEKGRYFGKKFEIEKHKYFQSVKNYFKYNDKKTLDVLSIMNTKDLEYIHGQMSMIANHK